MQTRDDGLISNRDKSLYWEKDRIEITTNPVKMVEIAKINFRVY